MPNILFISENQTFANDLKEQINLYAKDFEIYDKDDNILFDVMIIDDNIDIFKEMRNHHSKTPAIILLKSDEDSIESSTLNNVIYKPFGLNNFLNQLYSSINLFENSNEGILSFNKYELHPVSKEILNLRNNNLIKLTEKEVSIIKYLYKAKDKIVSKNELLQEVWGYNPEASTHTIETHIYRLRQKVEQEDETAQLITTLEGGYQLKL